jgi:hypothetical protein
MRPAIAALVMMTLVAIPFQAFGRSDAPAVYNHLSDRRTPLDVLIHEHFDKLYNVIDVTDREHKWESPSGTEGMGPHPPVFVEGRCISGNALVAYVISTEGAVVDPYVIKATEPRLGEAASRSMSKRRFRPGALDGRAVPSLAATLVGFSCPQDAK